MLRSRCLRNARVPWCGLVVCVLLLAACATQRAPVVSREPPPPERGPRVHEVARGDTLYAIAWRYDTTVEALAKLNHLGPPYLIRVGDRLALDADAARALGRKPASGSSAVVVAQPIATPQLTTGPGGELRRRDRLGDDHRTRPRSGLSPEGAGRICIEGQAVTDPNQIGRTQVVELGQGFYRGVIAPGDRIEGIATRDFVDARATLRRRRLPADHGRPLGGAGCQQQHAHHQATPWNPGISQAPTPQHATQALVVPLSRGTKRTRSSTVSSNREESPWRTITRSS